MRGRQFHGRWRLHVSLALLAVGLGAGPVRGQGAALSFDDLWQEPSFGGGFSTALPGELPDAAVRVRLPGMPAGFGEADPAVGSSLEAFSWGNRLGGAALGAGPGIPFADLRPPEGIGFLKINPQVQVLEKEAAALSLGFQATVPPGADPQEEGLTLLQPALAWFQEVGEGSALQGFVGKTIQPTTPLVENLDSGFNYGMTLQYPVPGLADTTQGLFVVVRAQGTYKHELTRSDSIPVNTWELVPALHWRMRQNCWVAVGASWSSILSCSWQY